jgi:hypothetical protein
MKAPFGIYASSSVANGVPPSLPVRSVSAIAGQALEPGFYIPFLGIYRFKNLLQIK